MGRQSHPEFSTPHRISVCISCRHEGSECRPGLKLVQRLQSALDNAHAVAGAQFQVSGIACMAGCSRPCTVAYHASHKATYLFGDIDPDENIDDLLLFAKQYAGLSDGWCSSTSRPIGLKDKTLARVPASLVIAEAGESPVH